MDICYVHYALRGMIKMINKEMGVIPMADNEIIKALECLCGCALKCRECPYSPIYPFPSCQRQVAKDTLALITRQQAIVEKAEKVEYFADKTIATLQAENERLQFENQSLRSAANSLKMHYKEAQEKIERLEEQIVEVSKMIKSEAVKEFAERL